MILELDFLQEVQILYERSVRLNRLQHSYTNRMDTFICNYITRHGLWSNPAAVGAIMNCLPSLYYPELLMSGDDDTRLRNEAQACGAVFCCKTDYDLIARINEMVG